MTLKKFEKKDRTGLEFMKKYGIVNLEMGVATLEIAAEDFQQPKHIFYYNSPFYLRSLSGIRKDGVSISTFATPAGSFFVPV